MNNNNSPAQIETVDTTEEKQPLNTLFSLNVIQMAVKQGFIINNNLSFRDIVFSAQSFLITAELKAKHPDMPDGILNGIVSHLLNNERSTKDDFWNSFRVEFIERGILLY